MISFAQGLPIGNAVKLVIAPSEGAKLWRILRKATDNISGESDVAAKVIYEGQDICIVDMDQVQNGTELFYAAFEFNGTAWAAAGDTMAVTPATAYSMLGPDPLSLIRDRVRLGLRAAVAQGALKVAPGQNIEVFNASPSFDAVKWPVVTVHMANDASDVRGLGDTPFPDQRVPYGDDVGKWNESEGWLARTHVQIIGWSVNPDERIALRRVIKAIVIGNLPVFAAAGMELPEFSQRDVEDFESYSSPVYQAHGDFTCLAPAVLNDMQDFVVDVTVDAMST